MIFPVLDGSLLVLGGDGDDAMLWHLRPPETTVVDSLAVGALADTTAAHSGDRVYLLSGDDALIGIAVRGLRKGLAIQLGHDVAAIAGTPSGDRVYVAEDSTREVAVVDRYRDRVTSRVELPGQPRDLRVDPLGRYLLVRSAAGDSVWIVAIGTDRLVGTVRSAWTTDLPFVAPDGAIALAQGGDVVFVDGATRRERSRVAGGTQDFWFTFHWTGFRPRSASLDRPTDFTRPDSTDTTTRVPVAAGDTAPRPATPAIAVDTAPRGFVVSFAALLSEQRARELASQIRVRGQSARVAATQREGTTIYRVLLGPYPSREEADRVGRESGQTYWVYEGTP
jgi:DNA-binding beta-propeller fold protein YncE